MKTTKPFLTAIAELCLAIGCIIVFGFVAGGLIMAIFGDESGALWAFSFGFALVAPIAVIVAIALVIRRYMRNRQA